MILSKEQINLILKTSTDTVPKWNLTAREQNKVLEALVNGKDFIDQLYLIEHKEDAKQLEARKKYSHSIKDMFERVLRPIDNIYSATGGVKSFKGAGKNSTNNYEKLTQKIASMRDNKPLEKWLQRNWMKLYHTDPNGVIFYEYTKDKLYPTYKNICSIRDYRSDGQSLEWILFEGVKLDNTTEWRLVDDENDYLIIQTEDSFKIDDKRSFKHLFGYTPGIIISDIIQIGTEIRLSPIDSIIELAKEDLRDNSQKSMFKFLLWSPIFWRYAQKCPTCSGSGRKGDTTCDMCNGTGIYGKRDITDAVQIPLPEGAEQPIITPNIAGYIMPDIEIMGEFNKEISLLEDKIYITIWGTSNYQKAYSGAKEVDKTATEIIYDTAPQIARLNDYADTAQWVEGRLTELAANFIYPSKKKNESICIITYGRNYIIEPMEVLLARYEKSKAEGSNTAILDKELEEWIFSKFKANPIGLEEELKRLKVEPFIHYTVKEVKDYYDSTQAQAKMLFHAWWRNVADRNKDADVLIQEFKAYCEAEIEVEEPVIEPIGKPIDEPIK